MLFRFRKSLPHLCRFCKSHDETLILLFNSCNQVTSMWIEIKLFFPKTCNEYFCLHGLPLLVL